LENLTLFSLLLGAGLAQYSYQAPFWTNGAGFSAGADFLSSQHLYRNCSWDNPYL